MGYARTGNFIIFIRVHKGGNIINQLIHEDMFIEKYPAPCEKKIQEQIIFP
jgi:hypothetical protein